MGQGNGDGLWKDLVSSRLRPYVLTVALLWSIGGLLMLSSYFISGRPRPITGIGAAFLAASILPWMLLSRGRG